MAELYPIEGGKGQSLVRDFAQARARSKEVEAENRAAAAAAAPVKSDSTYLAYKFRDIPLPVVAQAAFDGEARLREAEERHRESTRELRDDVADMRAYIVAELQRTHATALPHDDLNVVLEQRVELVKRIDVLRGLEGIVPADELAKAMTAEIAVSVPPDMLKLVVDAIAAFVSTDKIKISWKADATKLKPMRKFGDKVAQILDGGLVHEPIGQPVLKITAKESTPRNVTPLPIGGAQ